MCMSYGGRAHRNKNLTAAVLNDLNVLSAELFANNNRSLGSQYLLPVGQGKRFEIPGAEEVAKAVSKPFAASSSSLHSYSSDDDESSFADYEGSNFLFEDDSSVTSNGTIESTDNSSVDSFMHVFGVPSSDEEEAEIEKLLMEITEPCASREKTASRRDDASSIPARRVSFDNHVHIREYAVTVGCHSKCSGACPLELSWEYIEGEDTIDEIDEHKTEALSILNTTQVKIPAKAFHDSHDMKFLTASSRQQSLKELLPRPTRFPLKQQQKVGQAGIHRLSIEERRKRIAAVQGISVKQVKLMELESVLDQVNDSLNAIELLEGKY